MRGFGKNRRDQDGDDAEPIGQIVEQLGDGFCLALLHHFPRGGFLNELISLVRDFDHRSMVPLIATS